MGNAAKGANQSLAKNEPKVDVSKPIDQLPAHLQSRIGEQPRGSENVTNSDIIIPRIEVVQSQSKCLKKTDPGYIQGAVAGMLYNNVTRHLYGTQVIFCPVAFKKEWLLWIDRKAAGASGGNGFRGAFNTEADAIRAKRDMGRDGENLLVTETHQQYGIIIAGGKMEDAVLSMSRTKLKVSRGWNSLIRMNGGDRFSRLYRITSAEESNDKGDFFNYVVAQFGFAPQEVFARAEKIYELAMKGALQADRTFDEDGSPSPGGDGSEM